MKNLRISDAVLSKLDVKHKVTPREVEQCFENQCGLYLTDEREDHKSDPPTLWFVAPTNNGRWLKVVFIYRDGYVNLRTAFDADELSKKIYEHNGR